jgi:hypothetical protein
MEFGVTSPRHRSLVSFHSSTNTLTLQCCNHVSVPWRVAVACYIFLSVFGHESSNSR